MHHKLETYSLVRGHDEGDHKALVFERALGISHREVDHLAAEVMRGLATQPVTRVETTPHGFRCGVLIPVRGVGIHHGRVLPVTTGWHLRYVGDRPRLVSAYIKKSR